MTHDDGRGVPAARQLLVLLLGAVLLAGHPLVTCAAEYGDIAFERKAAGMDDVPPAFFPHWVHQMQFKCAACHNELFKMKAGANPVTMDELQEGRWCGTCHNGKDAFVSNLDTCGRCHRK
jgi:c(7)-type cytochrome triheme protein